MSNFAYIGYKIGMTSIFLGNKMTPVTAIFVPSNFVVGVKKYKNKSNIALGLAAGKKAIPKPQASYFAKHKITPCKLVHEFVLPSNLNTSNIEVGSEFNLQEELIGSFADVTANTIGKGFAGGMKRHGFKGLPASHGVSVSHRSIGSTGNRTEPGRVFPGKSMPGHMGNVRTTAQNLSIVDVDLENSLLLVKGSIPGHEMSKVLIKNSVKKLPKNACAFNCKKYSV